MQAQHVPGQRGGGCRAAVRARPPRGRAHRGRMQATWARVGCNTNLGILLLCARWQRRLSDVRHRNGRRWQKASLTPALNAAFEEVLGRLDQADAAAAFRAIALANPGGLGRAEAQDVRRSATGDAARSHGAGRGPRPHRAPVPRRHAELFELGLAALDAPARSALLSAQPESVCPGEPATPRRGAAHLPGLAGQRPDSHIVRKVRRGRGTGCHVAGPPLGARAAGGEALEADDAFCAWDESLKAGGLNPGSSADLTVATLMALFLARRGDELGLPWVASPRGTWHGS
jgi:triphosphoribosyl-dephospho-CoA synthase